MSGRRYVAKKEFEVRKHTLGDCDEFTVSGEVKITKVVPGFRANTTASIDVGAPVRASRTFEFKPDRSMATTGSWERTRKDEEKARRDLDLAVQQVSADLDVLLAAWTAANPLESDNTDRGN